MELKNITKAGTYKVRTHLNNAEIVINVDENLIITHMDSLKSRDKIHVSTTKADVIESESV